MLIIEDGKRIFLACGKTDMRKHINGLACIVESSFDLDLFSNAIFVFCNRSKDCIKALTWDGDGFLLHTKRLEKGSFRWPSYEGDSTMEFSKDELTCLLQTPKVVQKIKRDEIKVGAVV